MEAHDDPTMVLPFSSRAADKDYDFRRMLEQRAQGVVPYALPGVTLAMGYGNTLKQATANAVAYLAALEATQPFLYSFQP